MKRICAIILIMIICLCGCQMRSPRKDKANSKNNSSGVTSGNKQSDNKESDQTQSGDSGDASIEIGNGVIVCPDFKGMTVSEISSKYGNNFEITWSTKKSAQYESGKVCEQSVNAGARLQKGAKITLYISMGSSPIKIPDVYGKQESAAVTELKALFDTKSIHIIREFNANCAKDTVIKTEPARGAEVSEGSEIILYISKGKPDKKVKVPDVTGMKYDMAYAKIMDAGLVPELFRCPPGDANVPADYVVRQEPAAGEVDEGTKIKIYISKGQ